MDLPLFVNVHKLAESLAGDSRFRRLKPIIKDAVLRQSCVSDLSQALTALQALEDLSNGPDRTSIRARAVEHALLSHVILLYCRATAGNGKSGERGSVNITHHYTDELRAEHDAIVAIRNRVIAHVYSGELVADHIWNEGILFLLQTDDGLLPCGTTRSTQSNGDVLIKLARLIPIAIEIMREKFVDATNSLVMTFNENGVTADLIEQHAFDPIQFFGTRERVEKLITAQGKGRVSI